ncbi:MAG: HAD family hydrolase [Clostridiales bacterium]|jgi:beta-phosphoglucomutase-like phosphatase (HAD superfamily)|nr:HAD family hydrolase [Clostridiales bacterium]
MENLHQILFSKKLVIFDLDNTIVSTRKCVMNAYHKALDEVYGVVERSRRFPDSLLETFIEIPLEKKLRENGVNDEDCKKIRAIYNKYNVELSATDHPIPQTINLIKNLKSHGVKVAVSSIRQRELAEVILGYSGISDLFNDIMYREDCPNKQEQLKILMNKHGANAAETAFVGNMPYDRDGAKTLGITYVDVTDIPITIKQPPPQHLK